MFPFISLKVLLMQICFAGEGSLSRVHANKSSNEFKSRRKGHVLSSFLQPCGIFKAEVLKILEYPATKDAVK